MLPRLTPARHAECYIETSTVMSRAMPLVAITALHIV
jgi:hypothetical protein